MHYTLIPSKDLLNDYIMRFHAEGKPLDESLFRAIADDVTYKIIGDQTKKFGIVYLDIKNFKSKLPKNFTKDLAAIFRFKPKHFQHTEIVQMVQKIPGSKCDLEINLKCPSCKQERCNCGKVIVDLDADRIWRMANPEYTAAASKFYSDSFNSIFPKHNRVCDNGFKRMYPTTNNWFNINYYIGDCERIIDTTVIEYKIINGEIITNFEEGQVVLAYLGDHLDEEGYRLVPNNPLAVEAITTSVKLSELEKRYYNELTPDLRQAVDRLTQDSRYKIARARTELNFPSYTELIAAIQTSFKMDNSNYYLRDGLDYPDKFNSSNTYSHAE